MPGSYSPRPSDRRRAMRGSALFGILFLAAAAATAQQPAGKPLTPEALVGLRRLSDPEFSPDGARVAFVVSDAPKGDERQRHVWMFETATGSLRQLTYSEKAESAPRWSPDGKWLAFLSDRDGNQQIYLLPMGGGEPVPLTKGKRSVDQFAWSPDGSQIAFVAPEAKSPGEEQKEKDKDDARVIDKDDKRARLWLLGVADKTEKALTPANVVVSDLAWFPDGRSLAVIATEHPESDRNTERIFRVEASDPTSAMKLLFAPRGPFDGLAVAPSGALLSFVGSREDGPNPHDLWLLPVGAVAARNLTAAGLDRPVLSYRWTKTGSLWLLVEEGFSARLLRYSSDGARQDLPAAPVMPTSFAMDAAGAVAFVGESAGEPQELWFAAAGHAASRVSEFN